MKRLFVIVSLLLAHTPASAAPFHGLAQAKDGDSLMVGNREVRLFGIDAPEWDQSCTRAGRPWACGQEAAGQLARLVNGRQLRCVAVDTDDHGRSVARCTAGTTDVNRQMVAAGFAVAYRRYSMDYVAAEASAKAGKRGIWAGTFAMPSEVRHSADERAATPARSRGRRMPAGSGPRPSPQPTGACAIKGNRGSNGWIYHLPGMPFYARTRAEQIFCSESEAQAAGYRKAKVR